VSTPTAAQLRAAALADLETYQHESGDGTWAVAHATAALARATLAQSMTDEEREQDQPVPATSPTDPDELGVWLAGHVAGARFTGRDPHDLSETVWESHAWPNGMMELRSITPGTYGSFSLSPDSPDMARLARYAPFTFTPQDEAPGPDLLSPSEPQALGEWLRNLPDGTGLRLRTGPRELWQLVREFQPEFDDHELLIPALLRMGEPGAYDLTSDDMLSRLAEMGPFVVVTASTPPRPKPYAPEPDLVSPTEPHALRAWLGGWRPGTMLRCRLFAWQLHPSNVRGQLVMISTDPDGGGARYPLGPGPGDTIHQVAMFAPFTVVHQPDPRVQSPYEPEPLRQWVLDYPDGQAFRSARGHAEGRTWHLSREDAQPGADSIRVLLDTEGCRFPLTPGHPGVHELTAFAPLIPVEDGSLPGTETTREPGARRDPRPRSGRMSRDEQGAALLLRAAAVLSDRAYAARGDVRGNEYWQAPRDASFRQLETCYGHGVRNGLGGPAGELAATLGPAPAIQIVAFLRDQANNCTDQHASPAFHSARSIARAVLHEHPAETKEPS
jgi:hypothetical protein